MYPLQNAIVSALLAALIIPAASAQTTSAGSTAPTSSTISTSTAKPATAAQPTAKLTSEFSTLAGSTDNAQSLVNGLRTGSAITLTTAPPPGSTTTTPTTTTFTPPTKPMGYGNIKIALSLARTELASQGITNPTPEQLQGALMGTQATATQSGTQGILQMRASGMGWGQIANSMGFKLGAVMSGKQVVPATTTASGTSTAAGTTTGAGKSNAGKSQVTTAGGGSGASNASASAKGKGVVTAAGSNGGGSAAGATRHGQGASASSGVVSAAGGQGAGGASNATHGKGGKN